ncbi:flippase-like domain-containing protein [Oligoflexia bacterium]|nr:flippase-like domain-containing protein [Oligoflexia bacterium]
MPALLFSKRALYLLFSTIVTAGIFYYLFSYVSLRDVLLLIKEVNLNALLIFVLLSFSMSFFRTWRYAILLRASDLSPKALPLFLVVLVRNFFSDLLPARLGTAVYIFLVNTRLHIPLGAATSSFALAFLFDLLAIIPLILIAVAMMATTSEMLNPTMLSVCAVSLGLVVISFLYLLPTACRILTAVTQKTPLLRTTFKQAVMEFLSSMQSELEKTRAANIYGKVLALSLLVRVCKYASLYVFLYALLFPLGYSLSELPIGGVFLGICSSELAASLPISGIGAFGLYEGAWAFTFELIGFPREIAQLTAVSHHLFTQVYGYLLGAFALIVLLLPFMATIKQTPAKLPQSETSVRFIIKLSYSTMLVAAACIAIYFAPPLFSTTPRPVMAETQTPTNVQINAKALSNVPGTIVFDSNRSGTFGIHAVALSGFEIKPIIDDSVWHEIYPSPAPDGTLIAFARTRSTSRLAPSDIWVVDRNGENPRRVAKDGTFPTFSADGKKIYFERKRKKIMAVTLDDGAIQEVFPAANKAFARYQIVKPRVSFDGQFVAFTSDKQGAWNAWYADLSSGAAFHIQSGCEPVWYKTEKKIAFINKRDVLSGSGISSFNIQDRAVSVLLDQGVPRGHEYFPTLVTNDRFLLYSAARENEHSHITANYQIFVRDLQENKTTRVTHDVFNNRWPKLLKSLK